MKITARSIIFILLLLISTNQLQAFTPYIANLGIVPSNHPGSITAMDYDETNGILISAGIDGSIKLWRSGSETIYYRFQLSSNPILKVVAHPSNTSFATLESTPENQFIIKVFNWSQKRIVFTKTLNQEPIFMDFSPNGSYLSYSIVARNGLVFLNAENGRQLSYLNKPLGIISFLTYSEDEQRVMLYNSALGVFSYYDLRSGRLLAEIPGLSSLEDLVIMPNRRHAVGIGVDNNNDDSIILIDVVNGEELDRLLIDGPQNLISHHATNNAHPSLQHKWAKLFSRLYSS
jgi:WD40 repeat protein